MPNNPHNRDKLSVKEVENQVNELIRTAVGFLGDEISDTRADLMSAYLGEQYGDEDKNRSQVVSTDVADTVDSIVPSMMRILLSGEHPAKFDPSGPGDEQLAAEETEAVSHVLMNKNNGFVVLTTAVLDALIQKNCVAKVSWETKDTVEVEEYGNLTQEELVMLLEDLEEKYDKVKILGQDEEIVNEQQQQQDPMTGEVYVIDVPTTLYSIKVRLYGTHEQCKVDAIPPDSFLITPRHNSIYTDNAPMCGHRELYSISHLIEMGFDRDHLETLTEASDYEMGDERIVRFEQEDEYESDNFNQAARGMQEVVVNECYVWIDLDGDGIVELNRIYIGGSRGQILQWDSDKRDEVDTTYWPYAIEPVDENPFATGTAILLAHKFIGNSVAERIQDLQRINTVLWRQGLDNLYLSNNIDTELPEGAERGPETVEDLLNSRPGKIIRTAEPGMLRERVPPQIFGSTIQAMQFVDEQRAKRTGVSYQAQGLDPNALNKDVSGALFRQVQDASKDKMEMIARTIVETFVRELYRKIRNCLRKHNTKPMVLKLRDNWIQVDPSRWPDRSDLSVTVGIGNGNKEADVNNAMAMVQMQQQAMGMGLTKPIHMYNAFEDLTHALGKRNAERYFNKPNEEDQWPPPQEPVNPLAEAEMVNAQAELTIKQAELELKQAQMQLTDELERDKLELESQIKLIDLRGKYKNEAQKLDVQQVLEDRRQQQRSETRTSNASNGTNKGGYTGNT